MSKQLFDELSRIRCAYESGEHGSPMLYCPECHRHWCSHHARYTLIREHPSMWDTAMGFVCPACHPIQYQKPSP